MLEGRDNYTRVWHQEVGIIGIFLEVFLMQQFLLEHPIQFAEAKVVKGTKWIFVLIHIQLIKVKGV